MVNSRANREEVESVAQEARALGVSALPLLADVSDKGQVDAMIAAALQEFGHLDILVSNAAIRPHKPFLEVTLEDWRQVLGVILDGSFLCSQAVLPSMLDRGFGRIIYITGSGAMRGSPHRAHVSAAKMGLVGLARGLATDLGQHNITVNVASPGRIDTTRDLTWYPGENMRDSAGIPMNRLGEPRDIAAACLFLASDDGGYITGQTLNVNGGEGYG